MAKKLYVGELMVRMGYTPENNYDPRYYDLSYVNERGECIEDVEPEIIEYINSKFGEDSYYEVLSGVIYTENYELMKLLQDSGYEPVWFDGGSVVDELAKEGYVY